MMHIKNPRINGDFLGKYLWNGLLLYGNRNLRGKPVCIFKMNNHLFNCCITVKNLLALSKTQHITGDLIVNLILAMEFNTFNPVDHIDNRD